MRVLLIEPEPEQALFLRDVLMEIGERCAWTQWVDLEVRDASSCAEASAILSSEQIDIALLHLPDAQATMDTFRPLQHAAPHIPMILLLDASEQLEGLRLVRDGAQDFLINKHIDCAPLAHAIENAIERQRLLTAARVASTHDTLTGLLNRAGFLTCGERDRKLAERLGCRLMVMVAEPKHLGEIATSYGEQRKDLALVEAADHLRTLAGPSDLLARIEDARFGITVFDTGVQPVEKAWARFHAALFDHRIQVGAAIFSADRPSTLDALLHQAITDLAPTASAMGS